MNSVLHLIDDDSVGGVTRMLGDQSNGLKDRLTIRHKLVRPRNPLPPGIAEDVVAVHFTASWSKLPFLALLRAQCADKPIVFVEHSYTRSFEEHCVSDKARFRRMLRLAYRLADTVVAVSEGQAAWIEEAGLAPSHKVRIIPPATDCDELVDIPLPSACSSRPLQVLAYGRFSRQKGFDVLLEAFKRIPAERAFLTVAGYGEDREKLTATASQMDNARIVGRVSNLTQILSAADIVVIPSRWEAYGLVGLEARAAARPIVVSAVDGLCEQLAPNYGATSPAGNPAQLANAILSMRERDLAAMGAAARKSTRNHYARHLAAWGDLLCATGNAHKHHLTSAC